MYNIPGGDDVRLKRLAVLFLLCVAFFPCLILKRGFCDGGASWAPILDVAVKDGLVYVVTAEKGGLYVLMENRWEHLGGSLPSSNLFSLTVSSQGHLFLSTYDEALFSKDRGRSWTSLKGGGGIKEIFPTSAGTFILFDWRKGILLFDGSSPKPVKADVQGDDFLVTGFSEGSDGSLWASTFGGGILCSEDGGRNWIPINKGLGNLFVLSMVFARSDGLYVGTMEGGVYVLKGDEWQREDGLPDGSVIQSINYSNGVLLAGTLKGVFARPQGDGPWTPFPLQEGSDVSVRSIAPYRKGALVGTGNHGLFYLDWERRTSRSVMMSDPVVSMAIGDDSVIWALSRSGRLFSSLDGVSWSDLAILPEGRYSSLVRSSQVSIVGGSRSVYTSLDGKNWTKRPLPQGEGLEGSVMVVESDEAFIAATSRGGLFRSVNSGVSWNRVESVDGSYVYSLVSQGRTVAVGTDRGFSVSEDGGGTWENRYIVYGVISLAIDEGGHIWAASRNGLWRWDLEGLRLGTPAIEGFKWSPFNYFTDIFPGKDGSLMGLTRGDLIRLSPSSDGSYVLERSSLSNNDSILSAIVLPDSMVISTGRGFYSSSDGGLSWSSVSLPLDIM